MTEPTNEAGLRRSTMSEGLAATLVLAAALLFGPVVGGLVTGARPVLAALVISALTMAYGSAVTPLLRLPARVPRILTWVIVGYGSASLVHLGATAMLDVGALGALAVDIAGALIAVAAHRRCSRGEYGDGVRPFSVAWPMDLLVLLGCAALATFWARQTIGAVPHAVATSIFPAWQDYFLHASEISYLRDYPAFEGHSQYLTAIAQPLYHRGSYALPALMSLLGDMPTLGMATAYWLPIGLFLTICGTYVFGAALGGTLTAIGAVAAVFLVPDASAYGFENRFLSFHWLMQMAAGSGYAIAPVLVALTVIVTAVPARATRAMLVASMLVAASAVFRVHIAMLAGGTLCWLVVLGWRPHITKRALAWTAGAALAGAGVLMWLESVALAPHFFTGRSHPVLFFLSVHTQASDQASPYVGWTENRSDTWKVALGFAMMLVAGCGAALGALVAAGPSGVLRRMGTRVGAIPLALVLSSLSVILFVPTPATGDVTDFGHRPFVLVYLVIGALAGAALVRLLAGWTTRRLANGHVAAVVVGIVAVAGLSAPWIYGAKVQQRWWPPYALNAMSPDAVAAGAFVRRHSTPGELILAASEDRLAVLVALTERRAYLSRTSLYHLLGGATAEVTDARAGEHAALGAVTSFDQLKSFGAKTGVSWYIADTPATQLWPAAVIGRCAYCGDTVQVYDLR